MADYEKVDYFRDTSLVEDPFPYYDYLRAKGTVLPLPQRNVVAVTGYEEAIAIYNDARTFSSVNAASGPYPPLPFTPQGDDITDQLEQFRQKIPNSDQIAMKDDEPHSRLRSLVSRLFTPRRLRELEIYIRQVADDGLDRMISAGKCEFHTGYAHPFAMLVITDLLGVPLGDREIFRKRLESTATAGPIKDGERPPNDFFQFLGQYFYPYIEERRRAPRDDIMSELVAATYPDGSTPTTMDLVNLSAFLFAAGQDTTAKLLMTSLRILGDRPDLQEILRRDTSLIPDFIEEALRFDGPVKTSFRLARKRASVAGVDIPAGTCVMMTNLAFNRDPRRFDNPNAFQLGRPRAKEHLAFGRGAHTCIGAPLARTEARIALERILTRLSDIRISDAKHGPRSARRFAFEPGYVLRGLQELHLEFSGT
jgi:cytochrome P450